MSFGLLLWSVRRFRGPVILWLASILTFGRPDRRVETRSVVMPLLFKEVATGASTTSLETIRALFLGRSSLSAASLLVGFGPEAFVVASSCTCFAAAAVASPRVEKEICFRFLVDRLDVVAADVAVKSAAELRFVGLESWELVAKSCFCGGASCDWSIPLLVDSVLALLGSMGLTFSCRAPSGHCWI